MDHDQAERLISERLDGERASTRALAALDRHLETCHSCRAFERAAWKLRETARFEVAPAVPDLVEPIMAAVGSAAGERRRSPGLRVVRPGWSPGRRRLLPRLAPALAAVLAGALVGSVVVGGPWSEEAPMRTAALAAADVARGVAGAAAELDGYEARFVITEQNLSPDVTTRELTMRVWFRARERFRLEIRDRTDYPSRATPTDLTLIVNDDAWYFSGPAPCPSSVCPQREVSVRNRVPFSSKAPAPTDLVLPLTALGDPANIEVVGNDTVLGRPAVEVEVPFERAASLFPFLSIAGSIGGDWRPFFPNDRVRIWVDEESWFPLAWEVYPATGRERDAWAERFGLPEEPSLQPVFEVRARSVDPTRPPASTFEVPSTRRTEDQGAREATLEDVEGEKGFAPLAPDSLGGLDRYRVVIPEVADAGDSIVTYADGLSFVRVAETRSWAAEEPFGPVDVRAEEVTVDGGVAYYEPAGADHGRRLSIHAAGTDLYLESNLSREELLEVAASLPVTGLEMPDSWRVRETDGAIVERVTLEEAAAAVRFEIGIPESLPPGFGIASVELVQVENRIGVTVFFREVDVGLGLGPIRLHLEPGAALPPASSAHQLGLEVRGFEGRWTPDRSVLEWIEDGVYHSIDAPVAADLRLEVLLAIAESISVPDAGPPEPR